MNERDRKRLATSGDPIVNLSALPLLAGAGNAPLEILTVSLVGLGLYAFHRMTSKRNHSDSSS